MGKPMHHRRPRPRPEHPAASALGIAIRVALLLSMVAVASATPLLVREGLQNATATMVAPLVSATGIEVAALAPHDLRLANHPFRIDFECTAFRIVLLFTMAVLVTPVSLKRRLQGLLIGVPTIVVANLVRIVGLAGVSEFRPEYFNVLHAYTFQALMVVFAGGAWAYWLSISRNDWLPGWDR